jgi:hypothetical protein
MNRKIRALLAVWALAVLWPGPAAAQSDLERARVYYNLGQFDEAIASATSAKAKPNAVPSATLIAARARLERFRTADDATDLALARNELLSLNPRSLSPNEAIEWQIGLGSALLLDQQVGAAAEMFTTVLPTARAILTPAEYDKLVEWWASTLSRVAEGTQAAPARKEAYAAMQVGVRDELERNPLSRPATYWSVVSARGAGDFDLAWNRAIAGWIRAGNESEGRQLRVDLDRFVTQTLIPERAQSRTTQRLDSKATLSEISGMTEEWKAVTRKWNH